MIELADANIRVTSLTKFTDSRDMYVSHTFKICAVMEGRAVFTIGAKEYRIGSDDVVVLNNRDKRSFTGIREKFRLLIVEFEPTLLYATDFLSLFVHKVDEVAPLIPGEATAAEIMPLFHKIETEQKEGKTDSGIAILAGVISMLVYIRRFYSEKGCDLGRYEFNRRMYDVLEYINQNYDQDIDLKTVSELMHMSQSAFSKCFLKLNGIGFKQYVTKKRIEKAVYLLKTTDETVLSIASACGFNNGASFYQAFGEIVGAVPGAFRRNKQP